jgi:hypothetical protein
MPVFSEVTLRRRISGFRRFEGNYQLRLQGFRVTGLFYLIRKHIAKMYCQDWQTDTYTLVGDTVQKKHVLRRTYKIICNVNGLRNVMISKKAVSLGGVVAYIMYALLVCLLQGASPLLS